MATSGIGAYLKVLQRSFSFGDATERSFYYALQQLLESQRTGIDVVSEPRRRDCGAPDFHVRKGDLIIGHIEAKDVGANLDEAEQTPQLKDRYLPTLPNLILTNFIEFRWYINGTLRNSVRLGEITRAGKIESIKRGRDALLQLLKMFLDEHPQGAQDAKDLALRLARYAHSIKDVITEANRHGMESESLKDLREALARELVPDLKPEQFADMFAQTLAYGFFAAWVNHPLGPSFRRDGAARDIPKTNPFLRRLFEINTGTELDEEPFAGYVDDLVQLLDRTEKDEILKDFGHRTGREDPVVHFYETFLKEYDPKLRELRGVYYTPEAVVSYMVRSVDHLLKTRFNCPQGLADTQQVTYEVKEEKRTITRPAPRVLILDPATGTGSFLYAIVDFIRDQFRRGSAGAWSGFVKDHLLPRLHGFELLMAPYAVAHLKLGMALAGQDLDEGERARFSYDFASEERLGVYLTNTLDQAIKQSDDLFGQYRIITTEARAAAEVKRDKPIMVVIGNPPYSGHSANRSWEMKENKRVPTFIGKLLQDYYQIDGQPLGEKNPKWLQDDYVKFLRFGQWRIEQSEEGILALITNHGYLDNPTFRGMRQQLMQAFTDIYILDLHGNSKKKERAPDGGKDENVFDIQQGVSIALFVKQKSGGAASGGAELYSAKQARNAAFHSATPRADYKSAPPTVGEELTIRRRRLPHWEAGGSNYFIRYRLLNSNHNAAAHSAIPQADYKSAPLSPSERELVKKTILFWHPTKWYVHALTVMPDHVHIIAQPCEQSPGKWFALSTILQSIKRQSARDINKQRGSQGSLWQSENYDRIIRDEHEFNEKVAYVINNAVKRELVVDGWDYDGFWCPGKEESYISASCDAASSGAELYSAERRCDAQLYSAEQQHSAASGGADLQSAELNSQLNYKSAPPRIWHADLWGTREGKYAALETEDASTIPWQQLQPTSPAYLFVPQDSELLPEYAKARLVTDIYDLFASTVTTARNDFSMAYDIETLERRLNDLRDKAIDDNIISQKYSLKDVSYWRLQDARVEINGLSSIAGIVQPYCYRPFDFRFVAYHSSVCERLRSEVMHHMLHQNIALLTHRPQSPGDFTFAYCTKLIGDQCVAANKTAGGGNSFQFPLYLYPTNDKPISRDQIIKESVDSLGRAGGEQPAQIQLSAAIKHLFPKPEYPRWPNLDPLLLVELEKKLGLRFTPDGRGDLKKTFGPEDVFHYIYAVLHCPTYRTRYAEFLKRDFPRVPFTSDQALFAALAAKGTELVRLHLLESPAQAGARPEFPEAGDNIVERVRYDNELHRVYINKTQYFANVEPEVWAFHVGGYQVCEKWLKDRKGRALTYADQEHYQKTVIALRETLRLMSEIDALITEWPIL